jgi:S1-C subfamily serine protease
VASDHFKLALCDSFAPTFCLGGEITMRAAHCVFMVLTICSLSSAGETRTWSDASGKFKTEAEFVSIDGLNVNLKKSDGKVIGVLFEKLSAPDQDYVRQTPEGKRFAKKAGVGSPLPAPTMETDPTTYKELKRLLEKQREASIAVGILQSFASNSDVDKGDRAAAEADLPHWQELADKGELRVGNKWVTPSEWEQMKTDEIRLLKEAHRLLDIKSDDTAKDKFVAASHANPQGVRADFYLGLLNVLLARYPIDAEKYFQESVKRIVRDQDLLTGTRKANYVASLNNLAVVEVRMRKYSDAIADWRKALEAAPMTPELVQNLGLLTQLSESAAFVRMPPVERTAASNLYAKVTVQNSLRRFDNKVGWLMMPYIDSLDGSFDEQGDEEYVNVAWSTGFCVAPGYVMTSRYPLADADRIVVHDGANIFEVPAGKIVAVSDKSNLALLRIENLNGKPLQLCGTSTKPAQDVTISGFREPGFSGDTREAKTATIVDLPHMLRHVKTSQYNTVGGLRVASFSVGDMIQHDAILDAGLQGAPLFNSHFQVVGSHLGNPPNFGAFGSKYSIAEPATYMISFLKPILPELKVDNEIVNDSPADSKAQHELFERSIFQLAIQKRAPRPNWSHRIEELHRLQREGDWKSYEDKTCMACNGRRVVECPNRACVRGNIRHFEKELKYKDPNTNNEIWGEKVVNEKCPTCGGTGTVTCPYCDADGIDKMFKDKAARH